METRASQQVTLNLAVKPVRRPVLRTGQISPRKKTPLTWSTSMKLIVTGLLAGASVSLCAGVATGHFAGTVKSTLRQMDSLRQLAAIHRTAKPLAGPIEQADESDAIRATMVALAAAMEAKEYLTYAAADLQPRDEQAAIAADAPPPASAALDPATLKQMAARAEQAMRTGNIDAARLILSRAAEAGDMSALYGLAQTYDPAVLAKLKVRGLTGDPDKAKVLYQQAADGGVDAARGRLAALN